MSDAAGFTLLLSLLAAAVLEEVIFRAGVQESLLRRMAWRLAGCSAPNLITAALFAVAHGLSRSWPLAIAVFPASLALGWLYERRRRLWPCIAAHAALNIIWLLTFSAYPPGLVSLL